MVERGELGGRGQALRERQVPLVAEERAGGTDLRWPPAYFCPMPARTLLPLFCAVLMWLAPRSSSAAGPFQDRSMVVLELLPVDTTTLLSDHREPQRLVA